MARYCNAAMFILACIFILACDCGGLSLEDRLQQLAQDFVRTEPIRSVVYLISPAK